MLDLQPMKATVRGGPIDQNRREFGEMEHYESGRADAGARQMAGESITAPWDHVIETHEPLNPPTVRWLLAHTDLGRYVRGKVIDIAAGTCWTTALISQLPAVDEAWAFDMSERFLTTTGLDMFVRWKGVVEKLRFGVGDFNALPFETDSFDTGFLIAALHHSNTPYLTVTEALRCIRKGGRLFILECPAGPLDVHKARLHSLELLNGATTEVCYSAGELKYLIERSIMPLNGKRGRLSLHPVALHPGGWKSLARRALRYTGLEYILRPPMTVYEIEVL
jgi:SAM-dependent methyltransferase